MSDRLRRFSCRSLVSRLSQPAMGALGLCAMVPLLAAQNYHGIATQSPWHPSLADGDFKRVTSGRYSDDVLLDACVQVGSQLVLLIDPGQQMIFAPFGGDVVDFVHYPAPTGNPGGERDRIIAAESGRVAVYEWNIGLGAFGAGLTIPGLQGNPKGIELALDSADGIARIGGLEADGRTLYMGTLNDGCPRTCYAEEGRFTLPPELGPVIAWEIMQWDGLAGLEYLVRTQTQFHVFDGTGAAMVAAVPASGSKALIEAFFDPVLARDRGFWFTEGTAPNDFIGFVFDNRYPPEVEPALFFGSLDVGQLGFFDYDLDGWTDLWFSTETTDETYLLYGFENPVFPVDSTFGLNLQQTTVIPLGGDPDSGVDSFNASLGTTGDFDLDGDVDFLFVNDDHQHVNFIRGDHLEEDFLLPAIHEYTLTKTAARPDDIWTFDLMVSIPWPTHSREGNGDSVIKKMLIEVFYQPEQGSAIDPTPRTILLQAIQEGAVPTTQHKHDLTLLTPSSGGAHDVDEYSEPVGGTQGIGEIIQFSVSFPVTNDPIIAIYQFRLRLLGDDGQQVGPALIEYYADDDEVSTNLSNEYNPWNPGDPDNGFGFHRRGGIGSFCQACL